MARLKTQKSISVSNDLNDYIKEKVADGGHPDDTSVISAALHEYRVRHPSRSDEARENRELWKLKGISLQAQGKHEEAVSCLNIALGIVEASDTYTLSEPATPQKTK